MRHDVVPVEPSATSGIARIPRIATTAFRKIVTPPPLQAQILAEYARLDFRPAGGEANFDSQYGSRQRGGISSSGGRDPDVDYAPISRELFEAAYTHLTAEVEAWAGCKLTRSFGYGIRSYGRGSVLHLHRDRVDTHVISCIIHVDDRSGVPWPLDFIDHDGALHRITFERGETLLYESLCPHARLEPFEGEYYRNMYLHWRPQDWDPQSCRGVKAKYASLAECLAEVAG